MSCQSCVRAGPCSSALIHHTAFYMDQYEWDSPHKRQQLLRWDAGWLITFPQLFTLMPICIVGWRRAPGVHWHLQCPSTPCGEHDISLGNYRYMPGMGSFPFIKYSVTAIDRWHTDTCITIKAVRETSSGNFSQKIYCLTLIYTANRCLSLINRSEQF